MTSLKRKRVGVLFGSLRRGSLSRKLYNEDLEAAPPAPWVAFRDSIRACEALLLVTPEYNRSVPGCLENATDVGSRPEGKNVFQRLPAAVVSVSPYSSGGFGANHALRQSFVMGEGDK